MKIFTLIKEFKNGKCTKTEIIEEKIIDFYTTSFYLKTEKNKRCMLFLNQWCNGCCCPDDLSTSICFFSMVTPNSCSKEKFLKKIKEKFILWLDKQKIYDILSNRQNGKRFSWKSGCFTDFNKNFNFFQNFFKKSLDLW